MPTSVYDNRERDGLASIRELARKMCLLVNTFGPIIENKYRGNAAVLAAYETAKLACTIVPVLDSNVVTGGDNDVPTDTPELIPGINSSAPPIPALPGA